MCGIAGVLFKPPSYIPSVLRGMINQVKHRGPDGFGFYNDIHTGLAHARLSIIDLAGGSQPIHNEDKTVWVVFNGEIFNYKELRRDLERSHQFYTNSDTEVIVHLYEQFGIDGMMEHMRGQFAIALWDAKKKVGYLLRDRMGVRPLFYSQQGKSLYFASEVKSLGVAIPLHLNESNLADVFTYWATLPGETVFSNINEVPEGCYLKYDGNNISVVKYWDHDYKPYQYGHIFSMEEWGKRFKETLIESIQIRLRADVPVGAYLSGGLDSSAIVALIRKHCTNNLRTFSIEFDDGNFDESSYQRQMIDKYNLDHTSFRCSSADIVDNLPKAIWHIEKPILRSAPVPMMILSKHVRESGYKVVLTGEGADEGLAGYDIFRENAIRRYALAHPNDRQALVDMGSQTYTWMKKSPQTIEAFLNMFLMATDDISPIFSHLPRWRATGAVRQFFSQETLRACDYGNIREWCERHAPNTQNDLQLAQYLEYHTLLSGYLLSSQGDRVGMANSIEGRFPFLDHKLVELCDKMPIGYKLSGMNEKAILKHVMKGLIPDSIVERKKQPYRAPDAKAFIDNMPDYANDLLDLPQILRYNIFDPRKVAFLLKKLASGKEITFRDNTAFMGILTTQLLQHELVDKCQQANDIDDTHITIDEYKEAA